MKARNLFCAITGKDNCSGSASKTIRLCFLGTSAHSRITGSLQNASTEGYIRFRLLFLSISPLQRPFTIHKSNRGAAYSWIQQKIFACLRAYGRILRLILLQRYAKPSETASKSLTLLYRMPGAYPYTVYAPPSNCIAGDYRHFQKYITQDFQKKKKRICAGIIPLTSAF